MAFDRIRISSNALTPQRDPLRFEFGSSADGRFQLLDDRPVPSARCSRIKPLLLYDQNLKAQHTDRSGGSNKANCTMASAVQATGGLLYRIVSQT